MSRARSHDVIFDIVTEIATREGVEPTDLPPLARTVDPDALSTLVDPGSDRSVSVEFTYQGYEVRVEPGGSVHVHRAARTLGE